ncbi:hypothetical protein AAY473_006054, partial [Plecturocebus cupreus]
MPVIPALWEAKARKSILTQFSGFQLLSSTAALKTARASGSLHQKPTDSDPHQKSNANPGETRKRPEGVENPNSCLSHQDRKCLSFAEIRAPRLRTTSKHFGRPRQVAHLVSGVQNLAGQHGETPSLLKIQKLAERGGT